MSSFISWWLGGLCWYDVVVGMEMNEWTIHLMMEAAKTPAAVTLVAMVIMSVSVALVCEIDPRS
jgi:hypothetical protein